MRSCFQVTHLTFLGGKDVKEFTRRCLKRVISDKLAQNYSLQGHKGKKPFHGLHCYACIRSELIETSIQQQIKLQHFIIVYIYKGGEYKYFFYSKVDESKSLTLTSTKIPQLNLLNSIFIVIFFIEICYLFFCRCCSKAV